MRKIIKLSANLLTIFRIILVFFMLPYLFIRENYNYKCQDLSLFKIISNRQFFFLIFVTASITDVLDGFIAKKITKQTIFGKFFDPIADKLLIIVSFFYVYKISNEKILLLKNNDSVEPFILSILLINIIRDFIIMGVRLMAFEKKNIIIASLWGKIKTIFNFLTISLLLLSIQIEKKNILSNESLLMLIKIILIINACLIIFSGLEYIKKNFKFIKKNFY
ncbi:MAG: CDP-alcohol phosphatidyltransferase family protein [Candidatus Phytoplasma stylosanthis]|uniref:CDP-alcohol phosphatidyltransferase family protein n=1 Tax=Candidatus Phytoplasma stylosanthis TaxID=2798314 RepID=UPI00293A4E95|nr:CDP-alcohol phosphatidyltransferase family protein [Candidatus Phytoplasma stylosanthis]MDV3167824.1 CDP-alcohol phosphatidyltransferase family protein [Candidatus Phytoplasma stylosanthis]MDV3170899.1 CDP-alcohol phosphatidyltransferase family protein [Candidatus Phytoplasma stylosanthis]MDV3173729.1 CDP-alcohol phosphatidyltransferase family protein [Candidatus Phytoplasma stylosanthis]MDV3174079.1 CDP-alcohol phosphatidyltransferase family protein [Candidatus Phytoplasma stylosanthis]MDV